MQAASTLALSFLLAINSSVALIEIHGLSTCCFTDAMGDSAVYELLAAASPSGVRIITNQF